MKEQKKHKVAVRNNSEEQKPIPQEEVDQKTGEVSPSEPLTYYKFEDLKYTMEEGEWFLSMTLDAHIPKLWMMYKMRWVVDLSEIEKNLREVSADRANYKDSLLEEEDERVYANFARREAEILQRKDEMISMYEDIELEVGVEKMSRKPGGTSITFKIPSSAIEQLNKHRQDEINYKVCLIRF